MVKKMTNYPFRNFTFSSRNLIAEFIKHAVVPGANHFFENRIEPLISEVGAYLDKRLGDPARIAIPARAD
jgi:hypothetical protein